MRIGSLFSGAGALDIAVQQAFGGEIIWHCENDPAASKVLHAHWPHIPNHGDITHIDWTQVEPVDILTAGWPCQPFSLAGKRKGADDERALWSHVARAIRLVRRRIIVLENVSAVLGPEFSRVANDLATLRYEFAWTCLRASDVGAPHRRERIFILATDAECKRLPGAERGPDTAVSGAADGVDLLPTPTAARSGRNQSPSPGAAIRPSLDSITDLLPTPRTSDTNGAGQHGDGGLDLRTALTLLQTPSTADGNGSRKARGGDRSNEPLLPGQAIEMATNWGKYAPAIARWEQQTRPAPAPAKPDRTGKPPLNPAFSEWMLGWPQGWATDLVARNDALRIIGNGVVPQQAIAALQYLLSIRRAAA